MSAGIATASAQVRLHTACGWADTEPAPAWLPVRGWVTQQIMKMAGAAAIDAKAVLIADYDAVFLREAKLDEFIVDGELWHLRKDGGVTKDMRRHVLWHNVARDLLGLSGAARTPLPDYVSPICFWDPV